MAFFILQFEFETLICVKKMYIDLKENSNQFIFAFAKILLAVVVCFEKLMVPFLATFAFAIALNFFASLDFNTGISLILVAI